MEAKELRIRNWIYCVANTCKEPRKEQVYCIDQTQEDVNHLDLCYYEPIPLTEKWLLMFGFEKKDKGYFKDGFFCYLVYGGGSGWKTWVNMSKDDFTLALVGQVHELQNLYFALTGEELELKQ